MKQDRPIPFFRPLIDSDDVELVTHALRSGWLTTGPKAMELETAFEEFIGSPTLALSSGTAALHLGLVTSGISPGDAVITTPLTFASTVHVIEHTGATPLLVDVEQDTLNIDADLVQRAIELHKGRVRAVIPVHLGGHPCEMDPIMRIAREHDLAVVEDAAHALPAAYKERRIGTTENARNHFVAFSLYATKNLTTGEGGLLTGPREALDRARTSSLHGMSHDAWNRYAEGGTWAYDILEAGFKYNLSDVLATLGLSQLRKLDAMQERREEIVSRYSQAFAGLAEIETPAPREHVDPSWHLYVIRLRDAHRRQEMHTALAARGIGTSVHFIPIPNFTYHRGRHECYPEGLPVTSRESKRILSLPLYPGLTDDEVDRVIEGVTDAART